MFQTTRQRLALWYTTVTAIVLLLFASGVYFYVRNTLIERIDDTLHHVIEIVKRSIVIEPVSIPPASPAVLGGHFKVNVEASFKDSTDAVEDDHIDLEWFGPHGNLLWSTFLEPLDIPLDVNHTENTVQIPLKKSADLPAERDSLLVTYSGLASPQANLLILRQVTEKIQVNRQILGYLRVSHPWFEVTKPIRQLTIDLSLGISLMIISVGAIGWLLSGLAIAPIKESYQSLRQFTADASHELRNPIATIQTNVQVALAETELDTKQKQQLLLIERLTRRLGRLVDDLLFLARYDSGMMQLPLETVALDELLMQIVEEQQAIACQQNLDLTLDLSVNESTEINHFFVKGDDHQLARLFTNLISNAVQYTPTGGQIEISLNHLIKNKLQIMIKDNGIGMPADALPHIFDRFYRVDPARSHSIASSGLGLAIVRAIVETHQGQIMIDSQLNQGTTVTVTLPTI